MNKKYILHKSCATIPIFSFYQILKTNDLRYLIKGYFGENKKAYYKFKNDEKASKIFEKILKEFTAISEANKPSGFLKLNNEFKNKIILIELKYKYEATRRLLNMYLENKSFEIIDLLCEVGWVVDKEKPLGPQISLITRRCTTLKNQIKIKEAQYKNKDKILENKSEGKTVSLSRQAIYLQNNLGLNYFLDIRKCTAETWLNLLALDEEKQKHKTK